MPKRDPHRALAQGIEEALSHRSGPFGKQPLSLTRADWCLILETLYAAARKPGRAKHSEAQLRALRIVAKRDHIPGEPRLRWLHAGTAKSLLREGLIVTRPGTETGNRHLLPSPIVDLTDAGRAVLAARIEGGDEP